MGMHSTPTLVSASDAKQDEENSEFFFACSGGDLAVVTEQLARDSSLIHKTTQDGEHCLHLVSLSAAVSLTLWRGVWSCWSDAASFV